MSFFYKIQTAERGRDWERVSKTFKRCQWDDGLSFEKENTTTFSTELSIDQKYFFRRAPVPSVTSKTPFLFSKPPSFCCAWGLPLLPPKEKKGGEKRKGSSHLPTPPASCQDRAPHSPGRCGRPESCTKRLSWPVPRPPLPPLPPPAPLPPPPPPAASLPPAVPVPALGGRHDRLTTAAAWSRQPVARQH